MATYVVKKGDTAPVVSDTLEDSTGAVVNLTGATVKFHMATWDRQTVLVNGTAVGPSGGAFDTTGYVQYQWQAGDVATAGTYRGEWEVTFAGGVKETWPNDGWAVVYIPADLA
jgi:hypothetical protein